MDVAGLLRSLTRDVAGEVRSDPASLEMYASDASIYRRRPVATLRAIRVEDLEAAMCACASHGVPLTMRGAGTSLAGQTLGRGLVVDCSALRRLHVDPGEATADVEPGVVLDQLNAAAATHGLLFGPDVATANRATLGGMIANNSAGARSVAYGLTADHVVALDVVLADGTRARLKAGTEPPAAIRAAAPLADDASFPSLLRRVSGYNLDALHGPDPDWPRLIAGSEGSLAVMLSAQVRLVPTPDARGLALIPFDSTEEALAAVPALLEPGPSAIELLDRELLDPANRARSEAGLVDFGSGARAMLMVEHSGPAETIRERLTAIDGARLVLDEAGQAGVWAVRRSGIARALGGGGDARPLPFVEDPAVPPGRLAHFYREAGRILRDEGLPAVWYGHASVGCLHIRPLLDLRAPGAVPRMRRVAEAMADLVADCDGSLSGEHGDGRLRSELLPRMYDAPTIRAFAAVKNLLDPERLLNPGVIVDAEPLDSGLRLAESPPRRHLPAAIGFGREGGLQRAAEACNGNGACRKTTPTMCPSFQALGDERHSTRGRAAVFRAALEGRLPAGLADDGLNEALDLCLGCKACVAECPAGVDMARMKVEALAHRRAAGGLGARAYLAAHAHALMAAGSLAPTLARAGARVAGRVVGRPLPMPTRRWRPRPQRSDGSPVVLLADTFTRFLHPGVGDAALRVLESAGAAVRVVNPGCCGRPLLSQGLVEEARRSARRALDRLAPALVAGQPIVVLEPSCWSMLVDDIPSLLDGDPRVAWLADGVLTFEQAVERMGLGELAPDGSDVVVHPHCHTVALGGAPASLRAVATAAPNARPSGAGCCGMAGAFGLMHPELSRAIGAARLAPRAREADVVVASGTSCRAQIAELSGRAALHPAEYLASRIHRPTDPA